MVVLTEREDAEYWLNPNNAWVDPMMTLIATYESIRRGALTRQPDLIGAMLSALRVHFKGSADVEIIAQLVGQDTNTDPRPPLVSDGFIVWQLEGRELPLPAKNLSYTGAWTSWRGAMEELANAAIANVSEKIKSSTGDNQESDDGDQEMEA
jgi:hypothetical protein